MTIPLTEDDLAALIAEAGLKLSNTVVDGLTGTIAGPAARPLLRHRLDRQKPRSYVVSFVDVCDMKAVNDRFGHAAGDKLLARVGQTIFGQIRKASDVFRIGGDEFLIVHPVDPRKAVTARALIEERLRAAFDGVEGPRASVGSVIFDGDFAATLAAADAAMFAHKKAQKEPA